MTKLQMRRRTILAAAPMLVAAPYVVRAQGRASPRRPRSCWRSAASPPSITCRSRSRRRKGFFKEAGLDVEINDFQGGAKSLQALMGGSADVVAGAYEHTIRMQQRGQPIMGFALIGRGMQLAIGLRKDVAAKVKGPADIKGMKFGVTAPGSQTNMLVNFWAAKGGLKATDIVAIGVGAGASVVAAIEKGEVDGVSQSDPALTILTEKKLIKIMLDTRTMKGNQELFGGAFPAACLYAQPDLLKKTPNTAQALATAIVRANEWLQTATPADVAKVGARGLSAGRSRGLREVVRRRARDDLAGRPDAGGRHGECAEVPRRRRSEDRGRRRQDQARGHLDQRVRAARRQAQLARRADERRAGARAGRHHLPLRRPRRREAMPTRRSPTPRSNVAKGEFVSVVGPTGCGKSTLLNVAAGLLEPSSGTVEVFGERLLAAEGVNRRAGYMFQADALMPWRIGIDNVIAGLEFRGVARAEALVQGEEWLRRVGLAGFGDRYPHQMSGGMRKRLALAQTLILSPDILLMDEPFSALDVQTRQLMENELLALWAEDRKSVLFITHDLEEAIALSDRVVVLSAGPATRPIGDFRVDLPRPRDVSEIRMTPAFAKLHREIWGAMKEEVLKAYAAQKVA